MRSRILVLLLSFIAAASVITACGGDDSQAVKIGVADASESYWNVFKQKASAAGIDVELVNFTDYNQPNPALAEGELDLNEFQHLLYLATYNAKNNKDLVPIARPRSTRYRCTPLSTSPSVRSRRGRRSQSPMTPPIRHADCWCSRRPDSSR